MPPGDPKEAPMWPSRAKGSFSQPRLPHRPLGGRWTGVDRAGLRCQREVGTRGEAHLEPRMSLMATAKGSGFIQSTAGSRAWPETEDRHWHARLGLAMQDSKLVESQEAAARICQGVWLGFLSKVGQWLERWMGQREGSGPGGQGQRAGVRVWRAVKSANRLGLRVCDPIGQVLRPGAKVTSFVG